MTISGWITGALAMVVAAACGGSGGSSAVCGPTQSCPAGQNCQQGICVATDGGGATGGVAGSSTGGNAGAAGSSASGGTGGVAGDSGLGGAAGIGGSGGVGGSGGAAGSGGSPPCTPTLIDDMESNPSGALLVCDGRVGGWFTANDELAGTTQTPASLPASVYALPYVTPGASGAGHAIRSYGTCSSVTGAWGALVGLALNDAGTGSEAYDAASRGYVGVRFQARRAGTAASTLRVEFPDRYTDPNGGFCTTCFDHWGATITLSSSWTTHTIYWTQLSSGAWGVPNQSFDPSGMFVIQWLFPQATTSFDIYLDDVEFVTN